MLALLAAALLAQDGDVDRIQLQFQQRREKVQNEAQFKQLLSDARDALEAFLKAHPKHKDAPRAAFQIAETYLSGQDYDRASEKLKAYLQDYPSGSDVPSARFALAEIHLEKERDAEARSAFEEFAKLYPNDDRTVYARLYAAVTFQNEKRHDDAIAALKPTREDFKTRKESWGAMMQLAIVYHIQDKQAEARRILEEIIRDCPEKEPVEIARRHLTEYLKVGKDAIGFAEKDIEGKEASLDKLRGRVVVIYFFDPATLSAISEGQFIKKAREEAVRAGRGDDLAVVGVSIGTDRKDLPLYRAMVKSDWMLIFDGRGIDGKFARLYDIRSLPTLMVIDRQGKLRYFNIAGRDFRHSVAKLIEEK